MTSTHSSFSASKTSSSRFQQADRVTEVRRTVCYTTEFYSSPLGESETFHGRPRSRSQSVQGNSRPLEKGRRTVGTALDRRLYAQLQGNSPRSAISAPPTLSGGDDEATRPRGHYNIPKDVSRSPSPLLPRRRILFYHKHEPYYGFTNFSPHAVYYDGKSYPTSEHLFQSLKFSHRPNLAEHIRTCDPRPSKAFSEARRFQPEVRPDWKEVNIQIMDVVLWYKFHQHPNLRDELLGTGDAELIENSDKDAFWGIGSDGKGRNELGKALERLRTQLRTSNQA